MLCNNYFLLICAFFLLSFICDVKERRKMHRKKKKENHAVKRITTTPCGRFDWMAVAGVTGTFTSPTVATKRGHEAIYYYKCIT